MGSGIICLTGPRLSYIWNTRQTNVSMEMADPVKQLAGVLYRLDIHDHSQQSQSIYCHIERGLENESPCSVSGQGFHREITRHSFSAMQFCSGDV